eukprot:TRINITY_DN13419_c0_g1_i1.p1 TRINITY_DN13419_c0_g1~~TRINITY_DN13419_c0_g1_i1.p1  ORF type:complete len:213 (-),score=16.89 TRINITY_DN13419_c0_g1_i1:88-726(-)
MKERAVHIKCLIIGPSGVGKSAILERYVNNVFSPKIDATIGVDFGTKTMDVGHKTVKMQLWDTAGQESFKSITRSYYHMSHAAILVFDVNIESSLDSMKMWLSEIKKNAESVEEMVIVLAGNKLDLLQMKSSPLKERALKFVELNGLADYFEVSARTGHNIDKLFTFTAELALNHITSGKSSLSSPHYTIDEPISSESPSLTEQPPKQPICC